jgi:hypothetical protein
VIIAARAILTTTVRRFMIPSPEVGACPSV